MKEEDRQRAIRLKLSRMESVPARPVIPTGFAILDSALGAGGLPRGRMVEIFGPASCGKTTLALQIIGRLQNRGGAAAWIDAEHTYDPSYASVLGVAIEHLPVAQPDSAEQGLEIARRLAVSGAIDLLVVDSAAALVPRLELATGMGESSPGLHGRVLASGLRGLSSTVAKTDTCLVFLNQMRNRMERSGGEATTSAGGAALKLYASLRLSMNPSTARRVRFRILKNKAAEAFAEAELEWRTGEGFTETP